MGKNPFKYFHMWSQAPSFKERVNNCCNEYVRDTLMFRVMQKLKKAKEAPKILNKEGFQHIHIADAAAYQKLIECQKEIQQNPNNITNSDVELQAAEEYKKVHSQYVSFLKQKVKLAWAKDGDENSRLFHQSIKARKCQNIMYNIHEKEGNWMETQDGIKDAFLKYYTELLGTARRQRRCIERRIVEAGVILSEAQKEELLRQVTAAEVKEAFFFYS